MTPRALKAWRERLGLSQDSFAHWLGVSRSTVNRWEGGLQPIPKVVRLLWVSRTERGEPTDRSEECPSCQSYPVAEPDDHEDDCGTPEWTPAHLTERRVHIGYRRAAGDRRVNRFSPA